MYPSKPKPLLFCPFSAVFDQSELAAQADAKQLQATTANGAGLLPWDQGFRLQRAKVAEAIGLRAFVEKFCTHGWRESWDASTPAVVALVTKARQHAREVQQALGVTISAKMGDLQAVSSLLGTVGITTVDKRNGSSARRYEAEPAQLRILQETVDRLQRKAFACSTPPVKANNTAKGGASLFTAAKASPAPPPRTVARGDGGRFDGSRSAARP